MDKTEEDVFVVNTTDTTNQVIRTALLTQTSRRRSKARRSRL